MTCVLGIDVSTTASKAVLLNDDGKVVGVASTPHTVSNPRPAWSEQDPAMWWDAVRKSIRALIDETGISDVAAIGLTGQMHGLVLLDERGDVIRPAILWDDQRAADACEEIRNHFGLEELVRITGNDAFPGFTLPKLLWVRDHEPEHYARVRQVLLPKDYIRYRLTGAFATDKAGAGGTLMLDLEKRNWADEILAAFDLPRAWLPDTYEGTAVTSKVTGDVAREVGLPAGVPVVGGGGDQAAGAVGTGAVDPGVVSLTLGTSGVVFAASAEPSRDRRGAAHAFPHAVPDRWHMMGVMLSAAGSLRWYRDTFARNVSFDDLLAEAEAVPPGSDELIFLPYLSGERTPHADPFARGAFIGFTTAHGRGHATRAVLEGVAFGLRDNLDLLMRSGIRRPTAIRISGGGAKSALWQRIVSDVLKTPLVTLDAGEGAATGAAMLAGIGADIWPDPASAVRDCVRLQDEIRPDPERADRYIRPLGHFRELYRVLAPHFHDAARGPREAGLG